MDDTAAVADLMALAEAEEAVALAAEDLVDSVAEAPAAAGPAEAGSGAPGVRARLYSNWQDPVDRCRTDVSNRRRKLRGTAWFLKS